MKKLYNNFLKTCTVILAFLIPSMGISQNFTLTVDMPGSVAGSYDVQLAGFGPTLCSVDALSGSFDIIVDGAGGTLACDEVTNDLSGKIAIIDRGACNFSLKVIHAQEAGAIGVLVVDQSGATSLITMAAGDRADEITIPSFFILQNDGDLLKSALADSVTGTFSRNDYVDEFSGDVVYYEDFGNGFNGWTTQGGFCSNGVGAENAVWVYEPEGTIESACFGRSFNIVSPTRCNGALVFNSGFNDNNGACDDSGFGTGACPAPQVTELTSPVIDLSMSDAVSYSLRFHQLTAQFQSLYLATWSFDGGNTWEDTTSLNEELAVYDLNANPAISIPLPGSGSADSLVVRFLYQGNYYFWGIDDVQIVAQEANNLRVNSNFFAIPNNAQVPLSQVEPIPFLADIENVGALTQPNTQLNVAIVDQSNTLVFDEYLPYGNVPGNTLIENVPFGTAFEPVDTGNYVGTYRIFSDSMDFDPSNNTQSFGFRVTETLFAKEFGATRSILPSAANWDPGEPHSWAYGNYYYVPNGSGNVIRTIQFALGDPAGNAGESIAISVYEWPEDANNDFTADRSELTQVAFDIYTISGQEQAGQIIEVDYPQFDDPVQLKDNMGYIVALEYYAADETTVAFTASENFDYNASVFLSGIQGTPRFTGMLAIEGDLASASFSSLGFGRDIVPVVRMTVGPEEVTSTKEPKIDLNNQFALYPNPTKGPTQLQFNLADIAPEVQIEMFDISGRLKWFTQLDNVRRDIVRIPTEDLVQGSYTIRITTDKGVGTKKLLFLEP